MMDITLTAHTLNANGYWHLPINDHHIPTPECMQFFDQDGYDLCELEIEYSKVNHHATSMHRNHTHVALKQDWFTQPLKVEGSVLNHALIFERKGYTGAALEQLHTWAPHMPLVWKVAQIRPKWGVDFSIDWADREGNVFEILHYEFDSWEFKEIQEVKGLMEEKLLQIDFDWAAQQLLAKKHEWYDLDFFAQGDYKSKFFGLLPERFKMVLWQ
jgi:hypothetical protein